MTNCRANLIYIMKNHHGSSCDKDLLYPTGSLATPCSPVKKIKTGGKLLEIPVLLSTQPPVLVRGSHLGLYLHGYS